jgi:hypothetical protein
LPLRERQEFLHREVAKVATLALAGSAREKTF